MLALLCAGPSASRFVFSSDYGGAKVNILLQGRGLEQNMGWREGTVVKTNLLLQRTQIWIPVPASTGSQLTITPIQGIQHPLLVSVGSYIQYTSHMYTQSHNFKEIIYKIFQNRDGHITPGGQDGPLKVSPFHLFFSLHIVDCEYWGKNAQTLGDGQRPLRIPNPPTPLLVSVFMLSGVYPHAL